MNIASVAKVNLKQNIFFNSLVALAGLVYVGVMVWSIYRRDRRETEKHEREMAQVPVNE